MGNRGFGGVGRHTWCRAAHAHRHVVCRSGGDGKLVLKLLCAAARTGLAAPAGGPGRAGPVIPVSHLYGEQGLIL